MLSCFRQPIKEADPDEQQVVLDISAFDASVEVKQFLMMLVVQTTPYAAMPIPGNRYRVKVKQKIFKVYPHLKQFVAEDDISKQ